jgi:multidrug resistance efflux pump
MTWSNRLRLALGLIVVVAVAAVATNHLNEQRGVAHSASAQISAEYYTVGTPYAGLILDQPVQVGQTVSAGDALFVIDSATMQRDIAEGLVQPRADARDIDAEGRLIIRATADGILTATEVNQGDFVQSGTQLARVQHEGSVHVLAEYDLTPEEYGRLEADARATLELPDGRTLEGTVDQLEVVTTDSGENRVVLAIVSEELDRLALEDRLIITGAPLDTRVHLRNDGLVTTVSDTVKGYISQATDGVTALSGTDE